MKAFGVRLAAGAVTVLMGAVMAAQAQKEQQTQEDSAWTEDQIPPGTAVTPIGTANELVSTEPFSDKAGTEKPWAPQEFTPVGAKPIEDDASGDNGVVLVQHTESLDSTTTPQAGSDSASDAPAVSPPKMTMRLPGFGDAPAPELAADVEAEPSAMGLPEANSGAGAASEAPKMTGFTFADTPALPMEGGAEATSAQSPQQLDAELPTNDLRGGSSPGLRDGLTTESLASDAAAAPGNTVATPGFADTGNPAEGVPSAMLTPVLPGSDLSDEPEFAKAPAATIRMNSGLPAQTQIGTEAVGQLGAPAANPQAAPSMGITSQPRIVGGTMPGVANEQQFNQPVAGTTDQGYNQPAGGFAIPANGMAGNAAPGNGGLPYQSSSQHGTPVLPAPGIAAQGFDAQGFDAQGFDAPPMHSQPALPQNQGLPSLNQNANSAYQGVGYKQPDNRPPAGSTLASPGERFLDGPQAPSIVIHKRAPQEVKVGKPASFVINVKNVGGSKALDVIVHDSVPTGMSLTDATPRPNPKYQPELYWELGDLEPNQERTITLQLTPHEEGELGSVARVTFQAAASVRTISTRPELKVVQRARKEVLIGQQLEIDLEVSNPGTGEATGVVLQEDVPEGLEHPQGKQLDNAIGTLGPGEVRRQILRMRAVKPGIVQNTIRVKGDDGLETTHTVEVEVISPDLKVALSGPSRRYLERQATYNLEISNAGTADATNVEVSVQLDRGFTFVKTDFEGQYDSTRHAVFWSLPALPVGQSGKVPLTLLPVQEGNRVLRTEATADLGVSTSVDSEVRVDSLAELTFSIGDTADPIEIGGETTYEIRISNSGSKDDTNVKVALQLPPGLQLVEQGDFTSQGQGIIAFSPRALLKANDEVVYTVKAQGAAPGRHLVKAIVTSDQSEVPVTKEESIMVYSDR